MATQDTTFGASGQNTSSQSKTALAASAGIKTVTKLEVIWGTGYLADYTTITNGAIVFSLNGIQRMTASYNGSNGTPATSWTGNQTVSANTPITISFTNQKAGAIRNAITVRMTYSVASRPTVRAGDPITNEDIKALNQYKTGSSASPGVGTPIAPYVIGVKNTTIYASTYNNA